MEVEWHSDTDLDEKGLNKYLSSLSKQKRTIPSDVEEAKLTQMRQISNIRGKGQVMSMVSPRLYEVMETPECFQLPSHLFSEMSLKVEVAPRAALQTGTLMLLTGNTFGSHMFSPR